MDGESVSASDSYRKKGHFRTSRAPFMNRDSNVFDYDER